jgi:hypothetical protein
MLCKFRYKTKVVYGFIKGYKRHCQDEILELWIVWLECMELNMSLASRLL